MVTFVAYLLNTWALGKVSPTVVGTYIYMQPVTGRAVHVGLRAHRTRASGDPGHVYHGAGASHRRFAAAAIFTGVYLVGRADRVPLNAATFGRSQLASDTMIRSMTGFGRAEGVVNDRKVTVEVRSLNSKQLDLFLKLPGCHQGARGATCANWSVSVWCGVRPRSSSAAKRLHATKRTTFDTELVRAYYDELTAIRDDGGTGRDHRPLRTRVAHARCGQYHHRSIHRRGMERAPCALVESRIGDLR